MNVLILGGAGRMGPYVVAALEGRHRLRVTDVVDAPAGLRHEYSRLEVADTDGVMAATEGMDAIVNLAVVRRDRRTAFETNTVGNYNLAAAAVRHGIRRVVNTGPHFQLAGPQYEGWDFDLNPDMPPQPGTRLYPLTKALGQEVLRIFSERHDLYVQTLLFCSLRIPDTLEFLPDPRSEDPIPAGEASSRERPMGPFTIAWPDAGAAVRAAVEVELARLPSRCETYFVLAGPGDGKYRSEKTKRILGWEPRYRLERLWIRRP